MQDSCDSISLLGLQGNRCANALTFPLFNSITSSSFYSLFKILLFPTSNVGGVTWGLAGQERGVPH